jgi:hypothetical protein
MKQAFFSRAQQHTGKLVAFFLTVILFFEACQKETALLPANPREPALPPSNTTGMARTIQFSLFTNEDFSAYRDSITFNLYIRRIGERNKIWDTVFKTITINEVPAFANRIIVEKNIPGSDTSLLTAGFNYYIKNVGISWFTDTCSKNTLFKKIEFNFR